jgi:hypothetical protein
MPTSFQKRQKEMKRLEKQREKAERRAQKKIANRAANQLPGEDGIAPLDSETGPEPEAAPEQHN